ncbi:DUF2188 domain-containing protein [Methanothrix sp.]|jgi:hypothetical protein|uniref:DUF2188 domain-containing protein n=1 Tax=Methanothrix sp. TaxID=90426 RepID=UPI003BB6EA94
MARNERHVVKNSRNGWDIKKPHAWRPCGHAQTKAEAVRLAREICRKEKAECIIHSEDGKFEVYDSYGRCLDASRYMKTSPFKGFVNWMSHLFKSIMHSSRFRQ